MESTTKPSGKKKSWLTYNDRSTLTVVVVTARVCCVSSSFYAGFASHETVVLLWPVQSLLWSLKGGWHPRLKLFPGSLARFGGTQVVHLLPLPQPCGHVPLRASGGSPRAARPPRIRFVSTPPPPPRLGGPCSNTCTAGEEQQ